MKEQELNEQKLFYEREQNNNILTEKLIHLTNQKIITLKAKQKINNEKQEHFDTDVCFTFPKEYSYLKELFFFV